MKSLVLKCPFCGATKKVVKPNSEKTPEGILWSDGLYEDASAPVPWPIQRCPECGNYYFMDEVESHESDHVTDETGRPSLRDTMYIYQQFQKSKMTKDQIKVLYLTIIRAFNNEYREYPQAVFYEGYGLYIVDKISKELVTFDNVDVILKGELLREVRHYDESIALLEQTKEDHPEKGWMIDQIIEQAKNRNYKVFPLQKK